MISSISLTSAPTPGALLGTRGSSDLINSINNSTGMTSYFGSESDPFKSGYQNFMTYVIEPIRATASRLETTTKKLFDNEAIRPITSIEELQRGIPVKMYDAIALYNPIQKLGIQGRIDCFGFSSEYLKKREDYWGRLIDNGQTDITKETIKDGQIELKYQFESTDPNYTIDELEDIIATRKFCDQFLNNDGTMKYDFTNYPELMS